MLQGVPGRVVNAGQVIFDFAKGDTLKHAVTAFPRKLRSRAPH